MMVSSSSPPYPIKQKRCPNGTRRNKKTGECENKNKNKKIKRCPNGTHRNKKTGECEKNQKIQNNSKKKTKNRMPLKKYKISC